MAEVGFQQLLDEQRKSNKLLEDLKQDPSLGSSIKQNLGEILNDMRLAKQQETFDKEEGITQVDEKVDKSNEVLDTQSGFFTEQLKYFERQDNILDRMFKNSILSQTDIFATKLTIMKLLEATIGNKDSLKDIASSSSGMYKDFQGNYKMTASQREEEEKDAAAAESKKDKTFTEILKSNKMTNSLLGFLKNIGGKGADLFKGIGGKLLSLLGLFGLFKFLTSPEALNVAEALDKTILPNLKTLFTFLSNIGSKILDFIARNADTLADPDASLQEKVLASGALLATAVLGLYSKSIIAFAAGKGLKALLGLAKLGLGAIFTPVGLFAVAALGAYFVHDDAKKFAKEQYEKDGKEPLSLIRGYIAGSLGGMAEGIDQFFIDVMKVFGVEREKVDYKNLLNDSFKEMADNVVGFFTEDIPETFMRMINSIKRFFMGTTQEDVEGDIEFRQKLIEKRQRKIEEAEEKGLAKVYIDRQKRLRDADIDMQRQLQMKLSEMQEKDIQRTSGFLPFTERQGPVDNSFSFGGPMYKGGMAKQGQSIMVGELGPELMIPRTDAQIFSAKRSEEMIMAALSRGLSGGGEGGDVITQIDGRVNNSSSILSVNNNRVTNPNSTLNVIAMST